MTAAAGLGLDSAQAADYVGIPAGTFRQHVKAGRVRHTTRSGRNYFQTKDLDAYKKTLATGRQYDQRWAPWPKLKAQIEKGELSHAAAARLMGVDPSRVTVRLNKEAAEAAAEQETASA